MYAANHNEAMNEILDLQRDLHANDFSLCEEYAFGTRTFLFSFPFLVKVSRTSLNAGGVPPTCDTATFP